MMEKSRYFALLLLMLVVALMTPAVFGGAAQAADKPEVTTQAGRLANGNVELDVQVLAPGKTIQALRIDNLGGVASRWRSDGQEQAAPLAVKSGGQQLSPGAQAMNLALGEAQTPLTLSLKDNGAFAGKATEFRVTVFFADGARAMSSFPASLVTAASPVPQVGATNPDSAVTTGLPAAVLNNAGYRELVSHVDTVLNAGWYSPSPQKKTAGPGGGEGGTPADAQFKADDPQGNTQAAMELADDMAKATFFGVVNAGMIATAAKAVKACPHPLLLNNFAGMISAAMPQEALFFYVQADMAQPGNPIVLTNIASTYLQMGNFNGAWDYAAKALAVRNDYGPAYQVLTIVHLQRGESKLAAETMIKSAQYCWDDNSVSLFQDFLNATDEFANYTDTAPCPYPLTQDDIARLYQIARSNVDTRQKDEKVDSPANQLTLKPLPSVTSPDNLLSSENFFERLWKKYQSEEDKETARAESARKKAFDRDRRGNSYPIVKNQRQYYAGEVLIDYYVHKVIVDCKNKWQKKLLDTDIAYSDRRQHACKNFAYEPFVDANREDLNHSATQWAMTFYPIERQRAMALVELENQRWNEMKTIIEELWLKYHGLMAYVTDPDVFALMDARINDSVYLLHGEAVYHIKDVAFKLRLEMDIYDRAMAAGAAQDAAAHEQAMKDWEEKGKEAQKAGAPLSEEEQFQKLEKTALKTYKENDDLSPIGAEVSLFGLVGANVSYDGNNVNLGVSTVAGDVQGTVNTDTGAKTAYQTFTNKSGPVTAYDVVSNFDPEWFLKQGADQAEKLAGKVTAATGTRVGKVLGTVLENAGPDVKLGATSKGRFLTMDAMGNVTDQGYVFIKQTGGSLFELGRTDTVKIMKSTMTGITSKFVTHKYNFMFGNVETSE